MEWKDIHECHTLTRSELHMFLSDGMRGIFYSVFLIFLTAKPTCLQQ